MKRNYGSILLLALLLVISFHDIIFFGKTLSTASLLPGTTPEGPYGFTGHKPEMPFSFDTGGNAWVNEPNPYIIRRTLIEGSLPTWSPYEGLGMPLIANLNTEVFNPLKIILNLSPGPVSQDIFFLLRLFVMGLFTCLFLKEMKISNASSLLGSSFFMLSGYSIWWINLHPLSTVIYIPAIFYFYERWSNRKDLKSPFLMSLFLSFAFVSGKVPDVIMGLCLLFLYAMWKGVIRDSLKGLYREGGKVILVTLSGALMAAVALLPFIELYSNASPLAKAIRTGAAGHTIPLITSVSLFQPLFLGWKNYFYGSWLKWTPQVVMSHASLVIVLLTFYALLNRTTLKKASPFFIFALFLFFTIYGLLPSHLISKVPVIGSIEFLKYNAMFYFSLAVMSACAFDHLLSEEGSKKKLNLSIAVTSSLILIYFFFLYMVSPPHMYGYLIAVLSISLLVMIITGLLFLLSKKKWVFGMFVFAFLIFELFFYMPRDHPDRSEPYIKPPYLDIIKEEIPYRFIGSGSIMPPLVSSAMGLYDIRAISVLLPEDYYIFFENLFGFSVPQTNNPNPLFSATSPFIDLMDVKYILSQEPLEHRRLEDEIRSHVTSMRWVRLFDAMIKHTIKGGATYGFFKQNDEARFSFFFPMKFAFETKLKVSEPFIFTGFALKDVPKGSTAKVRIIVENRVAELIIKDGDWKDQWLDVSDYMGKAIIITIEGDGAGDGSVVLGNFGLSPGYKEESRLYNKLLMLHNRERNSLLYKGAYGGIHIYENVNVMERAFVVHKAEAAKDLNDIIRRLQEGINFREVGLVTSPILPLFKGRMEEGLSLSVAQGDKVVIKKYAPDEVEIEVESGGGLLVLSDLCYPGWKVSVNGKEEKIIKVFGLLRGVLIGKGTSEVVFYYRPFSLYTGITISATSLSVWIVLLIMSKGRRRSFTDGSIHSFLL